MEVGVRVVRGPDWQWRNQDDGEGHIGTIVEIGKPGSKTSPDKTVVVQWDSGSRTNYRVGYQSKYDLRTYDNAAIGVRHPNVICDNCKKRGIQGMRWKCTKCFDFDLCTACYMADKHDVSHQFMRFETSSSQGILVAKRVGSIKLAAKGIFKGALVVRGPDWDWQDQDGGESKSGKVLEVRGWDRESGFSVACVQWTCTGTSNVYRVGHKGKVDLKYIQEGQGGFYYRDHLAILGMNEDLLTQSLITNNSSTANNISSSTTSMNSSIISSLPDTASILSSSSLSTLNATNTNIDNNTTTTNTTNTNNITNGVNDHDMSIMTDNITSSSNIVNNGRCDEATTSSITSNNTPTTTTTTVINHLFSVGDKVKVNISVEQFKQMQEGHGGWNQKMADLVGKIGTIHRVTEKGDIRVQYDGPENRWTIYPNALTKVLATYLVGDYVRIISGVDEEQIKALQKGHGEWTENMRGILGKICRIVNVYADGDLRVSWNSGGTSFTINPACCSSVPKHQADIHNTIAYHNMEDATLHMMVTQFKDLLGGDDESTISAVPGSPDQLVRESAHGHLATIKEIIAKCPNIVDQRSSGKTALQVSCHQGHADIVKYLLSLKANLEIQDSDGDTALHYSCFGNQPEIAELLIQKNANINSVNNNGCSALHVAVNKLHIGCVKVLLKYKCDCNIQDSYGDTALHDIIGKEVNKESKQIIELLLSVPSINLSLRNKRGFNTLHHASLKGNSFATEKLIVYSPQLIDMKKDDGFSAFHLAALNGHRDVVKCLLQSRADKEILNNRRQTPLLLAVAQLHAPIIELLVEKKCNVNAVDEDGDTCLHLSLNDKIINSSDMIQQQQQQQQPNNKPTNPPPTTTPSTTTTSATNNNNTTNNNNNNNNNNISNLITTTTTPTSTTTTTALILNPSQLYADLKDSKLLLMISQNMPQEFCKSLRLIIASFLIQNGANLHSKNKHQISPLDYVANDPKIKDFLQKQFLALQPQINEPSQHPSTPPPPLQLPSSITTHQSTQSTVTISNRCKLCDEEQIVITFMPCKHKICCLDCSIRLKRCIECNQPISEKLTQNGQPLSLNKVEFTKLLNKIQALEEAQICSICMERKKDTAFNCGHLSCNICALPLKACHICREKVIKRIKIYEA